jgi:hypothetical protein
MDFIKYLTAHGVDVPTPELGNDFVNLGQAIGDHLDAAQDPNRTVDYLVSIGHTNANANMAGGLSAVSLPSLELPDALPDQRVKV